MKKNIIFLIAAMLLVVGCSENLNVIEKLGYLSFDGCGLEVDTDVSTKATMPAGGNYTIIVADKSGVLDSVKTDYKTIKDNDNKISLPAGNYTVIARSEENVPGVAFEQPVYGVQKDVSIKSGEKTSIGEMVCRLLQVKVTVDYSEEFLAMVTGPCTATVYISSYNSLKYNMDYVNGSANYDHSAGYFALNEGTGATMKVVFEGNIEGSNKQMIHTFENIKPCTWHKIKFAKKKAVDGKANLSISIVDIVENVNLGNDIAGNESIIGDDPNAAKGDGGITLESTCAYDLSQPIMIPAIENPFVLTMKATIPNAVLKFSVGISSTNPNFMDSFKIINDGSATLDLVNPSDGAISIFNTILPFLYGDKVKDKTEIYFDLSDAQEPILGFKGTHTFTMNVMDKLGCKKSINVIMEVN